MIDPFEAMRQAPPRIAHQYERAAEVLNAYMSANSQDDLRVLAVERELQAKVGGHLYTQRADLIASIGGSAVIIDHKSTGGSVSTLPAEYEVSGQMLGYEILGRALLPSLYGRPFGGVMANLIGTKPPYKSQRHWVRVDPGMLDQWAESMAEVNGMIAWDESRSPWQYRRNFETCMGRYGMCQYLTLCKRGKFGLNEYEARIEAEVPADVPSAGMSRRGYHRLATYAQCPQKFAYQHVLHLQPLREAEALALGSLIHIGLMHYYLGRIVS